MAIEQGFTLMNTIFADLVIFEITWIIGALLVLVTLIIITRDINEWKRLAFPICIAWHIIGISPGLLALFLTGVIFVINALSQIQLGELTGVNYGDIKDTFEKRGWRIQSKRKVLKMESIQAIKPKGKLIKGTVREPMDITMRKKG